VTGPTDSTATTIGVDPRDVVLHRNFHNAHAIIGIHFVLSSIELNELYYWHYLSLSQNYISPRIVN
jgi:hypothetical protein